MTLGFVETFAALEFERGDFRCTALFDDLRRDAGTRYDGGAYGSGIAA